MKHLLIVDDDEDIRFLLRMMLTRSGNYEILEAETGAQALSLLKNGSVDLMVLDYMLPDGSGADFLVQWNQMDLLDQTLVVMLTARKDPNLEDKLLSSGVRKVFHKPFDPMALTKELEDLFGS